MANYRYINTRFWTDGYIYKLTPIHKLLFMYLLTNPLVEVCGAYEIHLQRISLDIGVKTQAVEDGLVLLERDGKAIYRDGWVYIKNFAKHQSSSESIKIGIERTWGLIPQEICSQFEEWTPSPHHPPTIPPPPGDNELNRTEQNLTEQNRTALPTPSLIANNLFTDEEIQVQLVSTLVAKGMDEKLATSEIHKFISYWTEPNSTSTKQRWQMEKTFEVSRRLNRWFMGSKDYKKTNRGIVKLYE